LITISFELHRQRSKGGKLSVFSKDYFLGGRSRELDESTGVFAPYSSAVAGAVVTSVQLVRNAIHSGTRGR
jgi:hypothetical protein